MKKYTLVFNTLCVLAVAAVCIFAAPSPTFAASDTLSNVLFGVNTPTNDLVTNFPNTNKNLGVIVVKIISYILGFLGIIAVILVTYAGFLWLTAAGEEEKTKQATKLLSQAVIGLAIIMAAWSISFYVIAALVGSISGTP
ncbi:hypothetical protein HY627_02085 [Candidatus Uhrbacteria bacterium]|nr:hypothetical protein [Candidatus Uhrbacteria bacterium]